MVPVIIIGHKFDTDEAIHLNQEIQRIQKYYKGSILLDMSEVAGISSSALGILIYTWKTLDNTLNDIYLYRPSDVARRTFEESNLTRLFKITDSTEKFDK